MTRSFQPTTAFIAAAVLTGSLLTAPVASGAEVSATHDGYRIRYSPSELANSADAENIYRKLKFAAHRVCDSGATLRSLSERIQAERCVEKVLASVVQKIDQPLLSSLHASRTSKVG
jgi:UrcA family protein